MQIKNSCMFWSLLSFFVTYWLIFFPIIWFVIQPAAFTETHLSTILYAMFFVAVFILLFGIIYCCFKRTQNRHIARQEQEILRRLESVEEGPKSKKAPYFKRTNRPLSKCVLIPTVPRTEKNEGVKCTRYEANRDSLITIPLCVNYDGDVDESNYETEQELYFDGTEKIQCALISTVPRNEKNEGVKCTRGEADRDSLITTPLCVNGD